jgi:hypothetical protein
MTYKELKGAVDRLAGFFNVEGRQVLFSKAGIEELREKWDLECERGWKELWR